MITFIYATDGLYYSWQCRLDGHVLICPTEPIFIKPSVLSLENFLASFTSIRRLDSLTGRHFWISTPPEWEHLYQTIAIRIYSEIVAGGSAIFDGSDFRTLRKPFKPYRTFISKSLKD